MSSSGTIGELRWLAVRAGIGIPTEAPYAVALDISHVRGKKGIEVIGATRSQQINVP